MVQAPPAVGLTMAQSQSQDKDSRKLEDEIVGYLLTLPPQSTVLWEAIRRALEASGLDPLDASWLARMVTTDPMVSIAAEDGPCYLQEKEDSYGWLGLFIVAAMYRLLAGGRRESESHWYETHRVAEERRLRSAALVDAASHLLADRGGEELLGWRAVIDSHTTAECRDAHGANFVARKMPAIGWPGAVHMRCRCSVGPPIPGARLLPSI